MKTCKTMQRRRRMGREEVQKRAIRKKKRILKKGEREQCRHVKILVESITKVKMATEH